MRNPKTGLGFEIGQPQQKCQRRPNLQSMANPAVLLVKLVGEVAGRMVPRIFGCSSTEKYKNKIVSRQSCAPILSCSGGKLLPSDVCMWYISKLYFACSTPAMHWASCATAAGGGHSGWPLHQQIACCLDNKCHLFLRAGSQCLGLSGGNYCLGNNERLASILGGRLARRQRAGDRIGDNATYMRHSRN